MVKALSIKQPYASLITEGKKTIETRTWKTKYRGNLLICSTKNPKFQDKKCGHALCIAELYGIKPLLKSHEQAACCDYYPNAYSWFLRNIRPLKSPFPVKGQLGLFNVYTYLLGRDDYFPK